MKLTKGQWRMLMTELLETRNEASGYHAYLANRIEELRAQLKDIQRRLPPEPFQELHTYVLQDDGTTRMCEP